MAVQADAQVSEEALVIGTTTLKLGMAKAEVVQALGAQYEPELISGHCVGCSLYLIRAGANANSDLLGEVYFDKNGVLDQAVKNLTPSPTHPTDGEIGRALYTVIATLAMAVSFR